MQFWGGKLSPQIFYAVLGRETQSFCLLGNALLTESSPASPPYSYSQSEWTVTLVQHESCRASLINGIWAKAPLKSFYLVVWDAIWEQPNMISHRSQDEGWLPSFIFLELKTAFGSQWVLLCLCGICQMNVSITSSKMLNSIHSFGIYFPMIFVRKSEILYILLLCFILFY